MATNRMAAAAASSTEINGNGDMAGQQTAEINAAMAVSGSLRRSKTRMGVGGRDSGGEKRAA
jgi:hypothetical protein